MKNEHTNSLASAYLQVIARQQRFHAELLNEALIEVHLLRGG
jgi:hypothetical protein